MRKEQRAVLSFSNGWPDEFVAAHRQEVILLSLPLLLNCDFCFKLIDLFFSKMKTSTRIILGLIVFLLLISAFGLFIFLRKHMPNEEGGFVSANATFASLRDDPVPFIVEENETIFLIATEATTSISSSIPSTTQSPTGSTLGTEVSEKLTTTVTHGTTNEAVDKFEGQGTEELNKVEDLSNPPICLLEELRYNKLDCQFSRYITLLGV